MDDTQSEMLHRILTTCRVLSLAVEVDGVPCAGLLPFAIRPDFAAVLIHASGLARHAQGLGEGTAFGLVIHLPDRPDVDPLQLPRVTLQGRTHLLDRGTADYSLGRETYLSKFPQAEPIFGLGDFNLYELVPERGRLITGFGGALNIGPKALAALGPTA